MKDPIRFEWASKGFDAACVPENNKVVSSGLSEICVLDSKRIQIIDVYDEEINTNLFKSF